MKIRFTRITSMMEAFGIKVGDVYNVYDIFKNEKDTTYKYLIKFPKTNTILNIDPRFIEEIKI